MYYFVMNNLIILANRKIKKEGGMDFKDFTRNLDIYKINVTLIFHVKYKTQKGIKNDDYFITIQLCY